MSARLRPATEADLAVLHRLDDQCLDEGWSLGLWQTMLGNARRYRCWLLEEENAIGYILFGLVLDEAELLRVGVRPDRQGEGFGYRLLQTTQGLLQEAGIVHFHLEVRESNTAAQQLYRKCGWHKVGRRRNYYAADEGSEDALLFSFGVD